MTNRRYWVGSPPALIEEMEREIDQNDAEQLDSVGAALAELGFEEAPNSFEVVYKTHDLEEACEVAREARAAWLESKDRAMADSVTITAQPECPRCGRLGRFRDAFCASCGVPMLPPEEIDPDTGVVRSRR